MRVTSHAVCSVSHKVPAFGRFLPSALCLVGKRIEHSRVVCQLDVRIRRVTHQNHLDTMHMHINSYVYCGETQLQKAEVC